jgi:hypothetical protein
VVEENIGKVGKTWKEFEALAQTGSAGDASWKPYTPKGVKGNKSDLNNIRCEISRHFKNKKREYLKDKINELAMNSKNMNIRDLYRGIDEFKRGYYNLVKYENGYLPDSHNILKRLKNYFSQLVNVHSVRGIRQIEIHTVEPVVCGHSPSEVKIAIVKLEKYKVPGSDQIPAELIEAGSETLLRFTNPLILFGRRKSLLLYQFTERVIKLTV